MCRSMHSFGDKFSCRCSLRKYGFVGTIRTLSRYEYFARKMMQSIVSFCGIRFEISTWFGVFFFFKKKRVKKEFGGFLVN